MESAQALIVYPQQSQQMHGFPERSIGSPWRARLLGLGSVGVTSLHWMHGVQAFDLWPSSLSGSGLRLLRGDLFLLLVIDCPSGHLSASEWRARRNAARTGVLTQLGRNIHCPAHRPKRPISIWHRHVIILRPDGASKSLARLESGDGPRGPPNIGWWPPVPLAAEMAAVLSVRSILRDQEESFHRSSKPNVDN
jgi:hypothetical protein